MVCLTPCWQIPTLIALIILLKTNAEGSEKGQRHYVRFKSDLKDLARMDFEVNARLQSLKGQDELSWPLLEAVNNYLQDFSNSTMTSRPMNVTQFVEQTVNNPLSVYRLIQRVAYFLKDVVEEPNIIPDFPFADLHLDEKAPLKDDLLDAVDGILRIQFTYDLNAADLARGWVREVQTGQTLMAANCFYMGLVAKIRGQYTLAIQWLEEAKLLAKIDGTIDVATVTAEILDVIRLHDRLWSFQGGEWDEYLFLKPLKSHLNDNKNKFKVKNVMQDGYQGKGRTCSYWPMNEWGLCSGANFHMPEATPHLFCWLEFKANKFLTVGPLKMEFLSRNPDIVQIYNAFSDKEIRESILTEANSFNGDGEERITKAISVMTGLQRAPFVDRSEKTQVVSYVPGGHQALHVDSPPHENCNGTSSGSRIGTFTIHLNNVQDGGLTVFPAAFATAQPIKGSAIFWFNVLSDGSPDYSTAHADCPVVLGEKLVARKWIRQDPFHLGKCLLHPKERFQVPVNGKLLPIPAAFHHEFIDKEEYENPVSLPIVAPPEISEQKVKREGPVVSKYSYMSIPSLRSLVRLDWEIYQNVKGVLRAVNEANCSARDCFTHEVFRSYLEDFKESAYDFMHLDGADMEEQVVKLASNPLAVYRTIRRFEMYVKKWMTVDFGHDESRLLLHCQTREYLEKVYSLSDGPFKIDFENVMVGLLMIQFVHELKSQDIAGGSVAGRETGIRLSAKQCIEIGNKALAEGYYYQAIDWMQTAVNKSRFQGDTTVDFSEAQIELETARKTHDKLLKSSHDSDPKFYVSPVSTVNGLSNMKTRNQVQYDKYKLRNELEFAAVNFRGVCQGKAHQTAKAQGKLFCWYEWEVDPYWKIAPIKAELLSMHPKTEVVQYHDVLPPKLAAFLTNDTGREYVVSQSALQDPNDRMSATFWIELDSSKEAEYFAKIVSKITGLNVIYRRGTTDLQIASYTPGSHYSIHPDTDDYDVRKAQTRIATFMFYLTDVELGGGTGFAQTGVVATARKGSAILWYNTLSSGTRDDLTYHGSCPVVFGEKMVATQWILYVDQNHLQCDTDGTKKMEILVNGKSKYSQKSD